MAQIPVAGAVADFPNARVGGVVRAVNSRINTEAYLDASGQKEQASIIGIAGAANSSEYSVRIQSTTDGVSFDATYSYTTDSGATQGALRDGLIAAMQADPALGILVAGIEAGTNQIALTGAALRSFSVTFPANPSGHLSVSTTAAGWTQFYYGRAYELLAVAGNPSQLLAKGIREPVIPTAATLVITLATNDDAQTSSTALLHNYSDGQAPAAETLAFTSAATAALTIAALIAAAEALWPSATVEESTPNSEVTVTFPGGEDVQIISGPTNSGTLATSAAATAAGDVPELVLCIDEGSTDPVSVRTGITSVIGPDPGTAILCAAESGSTAWCVPAPGAALAGTRAYVDSAGIIYDAPAADRVPFAAARFSSILDSDRAALEL